MDFEYNIEDPITAAQGLATKAAQEAEAKKELDVEKFFLDFTSPIARPTPVIYDPNNPDRIIVSEQNIFAIIGEPKSLKSFCASLLIIDFFKQHPDRTCILIDTEQATWNVQNEAKRVCDGMGWDYKEAYESGRLRIAHLRPYSKRERLAAVEAIITQCRPYLCFVDGIRDLVESVNDDIATSLVVEQFMKWTDEYNMAIGTVLHTNKDGVTAKGHLGGDLLAKCETVLLCKKIENRFGAKVKSISAREGDIEPFDFFVGDKYVPHRAEVEQKEEELHCGNSKQTKVLQSLQIKAARSREEWLQDIKNTGVATSTAEKYFAEYVKFGFLIPIDKEYNYFTHCKFPGAQQLHTPTAEQTQLDDNEAPF